jgi:L-seryl-tRNA(Ser) seleniumtransferase
MLTRPVAELDRAARALARRVRRRFGDRLKVEVMESEGRAGGGALPQASLPSRALTLAAAPLAAQELEARLRQAGTPVIGRVEHGVVWLDVRTLLPGDEAIIIAALEEALEDV